MSSSLTTPSSASVLSVTEVTRGLSELVEEHYDDLWVEGELSDFTRAASGHCYFTLTDEEAQLRCVLWKHLTRRVFFEPEDGMQVLVHGHASVYEQRGALQIMVDTMRQAGKGAQQEAYEQLKQKLQDEGLFDTDRKRALPAFPDAVGVVTSGEGAAVHDILSGLGRRFPPVQVVLCPVPVQGLDAPQAIADAIATFNALDVDSSKRPDLLIVGRGGGSAEDLWAFNEEVVARAIAESTLPVVSAVGHESDVSIADFVADERAATPSMAAEIVVPDRRDVADRVRTLHNRLNDRVTRQVQDARQSIDALLGSRAFHAPVRRLERYQQALDSLVDRLERSGERMIEHARNRAEGLRRRLAAVDPHQPLRRGYAYATRDGEAIRSVEALTTGDRLRLQFHDGARHSEVLPPEE